MCLGQNLDDQIPRAGHCVAITITRNSDLKKSTSFEGNVCHHLQRSVTLKTLSPAFRRARDGWNLKAALMLNYYVLQFDH